MQASSVLPVSPNFNFHGFSKVSSEMSEDFSAKLKLDGSESELAKERETESEPASLKEKEEDREDFADEEEEEEDEDDEEFSFVCTNPDGSPIAAEEIFHDGQIRPIFPIFDRALLFADADDGDSSSSASVSALRRPLKKLFVADRDHPSSSSSSDADELEAAEPGTYCEWSGGKAVEASPEMSKKSNSTGFSRFWRFRDLVVRSSSDGKNAFVFLNPSSVAAKQSQEAVKKMESPVPAPAPAAKSDKVSASIAAAATAAKAPAKKKKGETASSAHERHYVRNRAKKEVDKRRSYLPYRPDLVGFFTNVNGLSRNVHPF